MESYITKALSTLDGTAIAVLFICAVIIAVITEMLKWVFKDHSLSPQFIQTFTLLLGESLAILFAWGLGQDWTIYTLIGLASAVMSTGIYEWVSKAFNLLNMGE